MKANLTSKKLDDQDLLFDCLYFQNYITQCYNNCASNCSDAQLRNELVNLLCEEHQVQADIVTEMKNRGFLLPQNALLEDITCIKQKFHTSIDSM